MLEIYTLQTSWVEFPLKFSLQHQNCFGSGWQRWWWWWCWWGRCQLHSSLMILSHNFLHHQAVICQVSYVWNHRHHSQDGDDVDDDWEAKHRCCGWIWKWFQHATSSPHCNAMLAILIFGIFSILKPGWKFWITNFRPHLFLSDSFLFCQTVFSQGCVMSRTNTVKTGPQCSSCN